MAAAGKIVLDVSALQILSAGIVAGVVPARIVESIDLASGTTDGQIDVAYAVSVSAAPASTINSYDLSGSLTMAGVSCVFAEVCLILLRNKRTTALAYLDIGPHATNGFGRLASSRGFWPADAGADADQGSIVAPSSFICMYNKDGVPVTAGTGDILRVTTSGVAGSTNEWDLLILGRSA